MSALEKFKVIKEEVKRQRDLAQQQMQAAFTEGTKELFELFPNLQAFGWTQYTPYFNDGDPCEFSGARDVCMLFTDSEVEESEDAENEDERLEARIESFKENLYDYEVWDEKNGPNGAAIKAVNEFVRIFDDDDYLALFGDHQQVTVTREGVETEEYSHD